MTIYKSIGAITDEKHPSSTKQSQPTTVSYKTNPTSFFIILSYLDRHKTRVINAYSIRTIHDKTESIYSLLTRTFRPLDETLVDGWGELMINDSGYIVKCLSLRSPRSSYDRGE
ncbi:hypothetical protein NPIL_197251 [Nephila pilipes]|uniref:Uncharacterized protein n=1 Tax=Nephila pilipes TaxID=299642 RepID=A0A8X6PJG6_NEPPI|nr:hypothetical protein NPIL_197251 [Nephila pilipes]